MSEYFRIQERKAIRIRTLKILALVILVLSSTLFSSFSQAQINGLSSTETANVESALDQLEEIADEFEDLLKDKGARDRLGGDLDALRAAIANLRDLFNDGKIKSVPDLDDESKRKYRHGDDIGSPSGAFCDDKTFVKNDETGEWEQCTEGDILISDNLLNPEDDGPIDPNTQEGWEKLIELSQLLFHEKWHEIMVARQLELLRIQTRQSWDGKTPEQRQALIDGAKRKAATPKAHAEVYSKHKNLLRVYKKILEKKKTEFRKQKYKLRGEARQEIEEQIADLDTKIDWLQNKLKDLEKTKKKAIHSFGFGFQEHGWPEELYDATLGIYVTTPSSYWLLGVMMEELTAVEYYLVEVGYLDEIEHEDEMPSTFTHFMVMGEDTFTALQVRPDVDEYLPWALETDTIVITRDPMEIRQLVPQLFEVDAVDGLNGEPLTGSTIQVYSSDNVLVMQEDIDETGPVTALLPVGDYYTTIRMNILGFDVNLKKSRTFSTQNMAGIELNVSLFIIPMRYFQPFTRSIAAVGAGLLSKWGVAKIGRKRLPKIVPWLVGLGVASAVMLPLLF
jgi:hypothetical protein